MDTPAPIAATKPPVNRRRSLVVLLAALAVSAAAVWLSKNNLDRTLHPLRDSFDPSKNVLARATVSILEKPDSFVLLAIDPDQRRTAADSTNRPAEEFHGFGVLGKAELRDPRDRAELVASLRQGIADSDGKVAACFNPRHGIIARRGNESVELLICFECLSLQIFGTETNELLTTGSPGKTFDAALTKAGLPRAK